MNKDDFFDDDGDGDSIGDNNSSGSDHGSEKSKDNSIPKGESQTKSTSTPQMSRIEAKLDGLIDVAQKIQRMIVSLSMNPTNVDVSSVDQNIISMLPLTTEESLDRFEENLNDNAFRRSVVSYVVCVPSIWSDKFCYHKSHRTTD